MYLVNDPRPTIPLIATSVALPHVQEWMRKKGVRLDPGGDDLETILHALFEHCAGSFVMGANLHNQKWPVDFELIACFQAAVTTASQDLKRLTEAWIKHTGFRFPKDPGEVVTFLHDGVLRRGVVTNVFPETAQALVALVDCLDDRGIATAHVRISAEEVSYAYASAVPDDAT